MNRKRIEIPENLFPILFRAHNRSMCITNIDLGLTQIHTDVKQFSLAYMAINKIENRRDVRNNHISQKIIKATKISHE